MTAAAHRKRVRRLILGGAILVALAGWAAHSHRALIGVDAEGRLTLFPRPVRRVPPRSAFAKAVVEAAHRQEGDGYDAAYRRIDYPNGDVPAGRGACTDVVIRSLRAARVDLQSRVHEDILADRGAYPRIGRPDPNIDHRRVPNLMRYFERHGRSLPTEVAPNTLPEWQPGDIVCWRMPDGGTHTGVVSDGLAEDGTPLVIDNAGLCVERNALTRWQIIGHYRCIGAR